MIPIKSLINKIKWDKKEDLNDYELCYLDKEKLKKIKFNDIKNVDGNFIVLDDEADDEDKYIPMHRIKIMMKKGVVVWRRMF